jgi:tricorn protease
MVLLAAAPSANAQVSARMFREPAVSATHIAFVYAGDIWIVPKSGGVAMRLSSPRGEESFPRFSPDGTRIAFSGDYDGNVDAYVIPTMGGTPVRLTSHPMEDRVVGWHPDGKRVLIASSRESGRQRYSQFYLVNADGTGLEQKLPIPYGEFGSFSPDGAELAYMPMSQDFRTWKRYRGGWAPDIWTFDLKTLASKNITGHPANDSHPMWHGQTIFFMSDRGPEKRENIWAYDRRSGAARQVTHFTDFDITFPSSGPSDIVFEAGGRLYLLDENTEKMTEVRVEVVTDRATLKPRIEKVASLIENASVSPTGKRAVFEARGDLFSLPAEHGAVVNLTHSSGVADRSPRWSPDGKTIAWWSDRSGEYELTLRPADGTGAEQKVTALGAGFRYAPYWSPDSRKVAFVDQAMRIRIYDLDTKQVSLVDKSDVWISDGGLAALKLEWSPDSRWLTYAKPVNNSNQAIVIYDTKDKSLHRATSGYFADGDPTFDPEGKYLFYTSNRSFEPVYSAFDGGWTYPNATRLVAVPLRKDVASPLAQRNDQEGGPEPAKPAEKEKGTEKAAGEAAKPDVKPVEIDFDGFEGRGVILPPASGNYQGLHAIKGKIVYRRSPRAGSGEKASPVLYYDLADREEKTVLDDADRFDVSADGTRVLVGKGERFAILDIKAAQKIDKPMRVAEMEAPVDPIPEWKQMFQDVYRFERDYFYDKNMHGVDWAKLRDQYAKLLDDAVTRWDVNFVIGQFISELNASHTYVSGGDLERGLSRGVGMLGVDWEVANGAYRVKHIVRGGVADVDVRSPLADPGVDVKAGDYVLAVNGLPLDTSCAPWAAFDGLAEQPVVLTVNSRPTTEGSRQVVVKTLKSEVELRFREWIEQRRRRVDEATGGKAGYIYVQSTGVDAQNELVRQFMAQWDKDGLVIDERWNSGGQIPDRFIELLNRPLLSYWATRDGESQQWPPVAMSGPKVMLINGWSGSGGDAFPFYFREARLGPLVGMRTWGGLIGISGLPTLVDGGSVTAPTFRMFDVRGKWFAEGHGVDPDIEVVDDPTPLAKGVDPQLERAIEELKKAMAAAPPRPARPAPDVRR